ncbi:MAG: hypothetical protein H0T73_02245, partial [Ardenticatenales bacterium]|nr:hypothetical protein [Ardenticatenales bacterium]
MATLAQIYTGLTGHSASGKEVGREVTPWVLESQGVEPGGAFVALGTGTRREDIIEAVRRGAVVVVAEGAAAEFAGIGAQIVSGATTSGEPLQPPVLFVVENGRAAIQKLISGRRSHTSPHLQIIAIVGTGGRATVKEMISVVLGQRFRTWQGTKRASDLAALLTLLDMPLDT